MGIIAFIKALAFISSIVGRIIALPFILLFHILRLCVHGIRKLKHGISSLKQSIRTHRVEKRKKKAIRREIRQQKRAAKQEKKRLARELRQRNAKTRHNDIPFLKGNTHLYARILRKMYWGGHWIFSKLYWGTHYIFQKLYWKTYTIFQKVYWKTYTIFQKVYWKTYTIFQKVYWFLRVKVQKLYWSYYVKSRKIYASVTKNTYIDLFFVFLRGYLGKKDTQLRCVKISGVREYVGRHQEDSEYRVIENGRSRTVCIPAFFEKNEAQYADFTSPDIYVSRIAQVDLIGGSNVIIADNTLLNDTAAYDRENRMDIRYSAIKKVINGVAVIADSDYVEHLERGINLVGAASFNYYHLVVEILSRLTFIDYFEEYRDYPVLIDEVVMRIPQFKSALDCINRFYHPMIVIEKEKKYHIADLILPSSNVWMPTNLYDRNTIRVEDFLIADSVLHNIRNAVGVWQEQAPWRKIFISRKNTQAVRLRNERDVRQIFAENGFEIVYTEEMTFQQQVECFGQAKCIVATSGAALTNTIFCQKGTVIGCIIPSEHRFYMYSTIAHLLGLKPLFLDAQITEKTPYAAADTFELDEEYVKRYVVELKKILD